MKLRTQDQPTKRLVRMTKVSHTKLSWTTQVDNDDEWSTPRASRVSRSVVVCPASQGESRWQCGRFAVLANEPVPPRPRRLRLISRLSQRSTVPVPPSEDLLDELEADLLAPVVPGPHR